MRDLPLRAGRPWIAASVLLLAAGGYAGHHAAASRAGSDPLPAGAPVEAAPAPGPAGVAVQMLAAPEAAETTGPPDRGAPPGPVAAPRATDPVPSPSAAGLRPAPVPSTAPGRGRFAIHLSSVPGAAGARGAASEWRRLARLHPSLAALGPLPPRAVEVPGKGAFHRVLGGSFATAVEAQAACGRLRAEGVRYCRSLPL
jgi:hypothetical protein